MKKKMVLNIEHQKNVSSPKLTSMDTTKTNIDTIEKMDIDCIDSLSNEFNNKINY